VGVEQRYKGLHFPRAFNPLARIYRESNDPCVRSTALPILRQHHEIEMNPQVRETLGELLRRH
jgi:hypothetical protein